MERRATRCSGRPGSLESEPGRFPSLADSRQFNRPRVKVISGTAAPTMPGTLQSNCLDGHLANQISRIRSLEACQAAFRTPTRIATPLAGFVLQMHPVDAKCHDKYRGPVAFEAAVASGETLEPMSVRSGARKCVFGCRVEVCFGWRSLMFRCGKFSLEKCFIYLTVAPCLIQTAALL